MRSGVEAGVGKASPEVVKLQARMWKLRWSYTPSAKSFRVPRGRPKSNFCSRKVRGRLGGSKNTED